MMKVKASTRKKFAYKLATTAIECGELSVVKNVVPNNWVVKTWHHYHRAVVKIVTEIGWYFIAGFLFE